MTDLNTHIAELCRVTPPDQPWTGGNFTGGQQGHDPFPIDHAIAAILNAVLDGRRLFSWRGLSG